MFPVIENRRQTRIETRDPRRGVLHNAELALFAMALFGTLFSIYLTFLEPFVIGATCIWCLTSALCMTLILLILAGSISARPEPVGQRMIRGA